jgi:diguanylate cyclase (GGDEF)-like protein
MPNRLQSHCETPYDAMRLENDGPRPPTAENSKQFNQLQELFDKSFKAARVGIWECTLPDETITWTDTVYELFGLEPRSPLTRAATVAMYEPESRRKLTEVRSAAIRDGEGFTLDAQINSAKGEARWIRITAIVERQNGVPVRLFGMKQDITAEKTLFDQLRHLAETDAVTGLASRAKFESMLDEVAVSSAPERKALLLIDLDSFKAVNDRLGHQAGDDCLREAARRISQAAPDAALVARLGGDEFAVIHDFTSSENLEDICRRVVEKLEWWVGSSPGRFKVSASIGAAPIRQGIAAKDIFAEADKALYAVKAAGKNSFRLLPMTDAIADVA